MTGSASIQRTLLSTPSWEALPRREKSFDLIPRNPFAALPPPEQTQVKGDTLLRHAEQQGRLQFQVAQAWRFDTKESGTHPLRDSWAARAMRRSETSDNVTNQSFSGELGDISAEETSALAESALNPPRTIEPRGASGLMEGMERPEFVSRQLSGNGSSVLMKTPDGNWRLTERIEDPATGQLIGSRRGTYYYDESGSFTEARFIRNDEQGRMLYQEQLTPVQDGSYRLAPLDPEGNPLMDAARTFTRSDLERFAPNQQIYGPPQSATIGAGNASMTDIIGLGLGFSASDGNLQTFLYVD